MLPTDRAQTFANAPIEDLLSVLLRQLKRPLAAQGFKLTDAEANRMASERVAGKVPQRSIELVAALETIVEESEAGDLAFFEDAEGHRSPAQPQKRR